MASLRFTTSPLISNNDWQDSQKQELIDTTIPPSNDKESALVTDLTPGNYTAVISGVGGSTGVGLAEVYTSPRIRAGGEQTSLCAKAASKD